MKRRLGVIAEAGVHRRGLNDRTAGGDQPVEALGRRELAEAPGLFAAFTDARDLLQVLAKFVEVELRGEGRQALCIQVDQRTQEVACAEDPGYQVNLTSGLSNCTQKEDHV